MERHDPRVDPGYEPKDINLKGLGFTVLGIVIALVAVVFLLKPLFGFKVANHVLTTKGESITEVFPKPKLQPRPDRDWIEFHARERQLLSTYGWSDRERGLVRVPIEKAMDLYLQQLEQSSKGEGQ